MAGTLRMGPLGLLVLQPTPFCNLDCRYCYLPDRANRARMTIATLEAAVRRVVEAELLGDELSIVWHAGEPMVVPRAWYGEAFARVREIVPSSTRVEHNIQTNATLVDQAWCDFIAAHGIRVGVSVDGPAFLHDAARHTRRGEGTHAQVMRGIARLQEVGIPIHAICVLTRASLDHPDEIFDFFVDAGILEVGFNIEERDGVNTVSTLDGDEAVHAFARFFARILDRYREDPDRLRVREIDRVVDALLDPKYGTYRDNGQNISFGIVERRLGRRHLDILAGAAGDGASGLRRVRVRQRAHEQPRRHRQGSPTAPDRERNFDGGRSLPEFLSLLRLLPRRRTGQQAERARALRRHDHAVLPADPDGRRRDRAARPRDGSRGSRGTVRALDYGLTRRASFGRYHTRPSRWSD